MLRDQIQSDQISALKSGEKQKLEALRYILSQIKNKEIDKKSLLSDEETLSVLRKQLKELVESIEAFKKGNRNDIAETYQAQYDILSTYLPQEISDQELTSEVQRIVDENKELFQKNKNVIIGVLMKQLRTKASSERIMAALQALK